MKEEYLLDLERYCVVALKGTRNMDKEDLIYKLKSSKVVRALCLPNEVLKRNKIYKDYKNSENPNVIKSLKDTHKGECCFIIGNGPSLSAADLDRVAAKGIYSFGTNSVFKLFSHTDWRPDMYMSIDKEVIKSIKHVLEDGKIKNIWLDYGSRSTVKGDFKYFYNKVDFKLRKYCTDVITFSSDPSDFMGFGYTVTFTALQMAIYMGFSKIYLIGMDHTVSHVVTSDGQLLVDNKIQNHFEKEKVHLYQAQYKEGLEYAYSLARDYAEQMGIEIYNATRGGKLEVFKRIDFETIFEDEGLK